MSKLVFAGLTFVVGLAIYGALRRHEASLRPGIWTLAPRLVLLVGIGVPITILVFSIFRIIPAGHVGVKVLFGQVESIPLREGLNVVWNPLYSGFTLVVVPIGVLAYLRDVLGDPIPLWIRMTAPGAFAALYALFLIAAMPDLGRPLLLMADSAAGTPAPGAALRTGPRDSASWVFRFGALFVVLAGVPGLLALLAAGLGRLGAPRRR